MNPFSDEYCRSEIKKLNCPTFDNKKVTIKKVTVEGRCDDYITVNYRAGDTAIEDCPLFLRNGELWMSLTPMEIQSQYLPIKHGRENEIVATVGLGIGYFTVMVMSSPTVKQLDVYEIDPEVIELFKINFSDRDGFNKVNFILGNFRKTLKGKEYDFCYLDPYQSMHEDEILKDYVSLHKKNKIKLLRHWGVERCFVNESAPSDIEDFFDMENSGMKYTYSDEAFDRKVCKMYSKYEDF